NSPPNSDQPPGDPIIQTNAANVKRDDGLVNGYNDGFAVTGLTFFTNANYLTDVGAYTQSPSYYGTFDQDENVWQWNETAVGSFSRGRRGGGWGDIAENARSDLRSWADPSIEIETVGFRVATIAVPEPSTLGLAAVALLFLRAQVFRCKIRS